MPFIAGENLRTRLGRMRELPVQTATRIMRDVSEALSYAHSQGVVHRDIKPENILLSGNHALVLDFGVSKALTNATSDSGSPLITSLGVALGTPAYMAPEQAVADPTVDGRADIYALGVVGYEMLSGRTPFPGLSPQQTLSAQVTSRPAPLNEHREQVPPGLAAIIMRCLEKNAADRWQAADDLYEALEPYSITSGSSAPATAATAAVPVQPVPFKWTAQRIAVAAAGVGILATALFASTIGFRKNNESLIVGSTRQVTNAPGMEFHPRISPDGRMVAFVAGTPGNSRLFVRQLTGGRAIQLTDSTVSPRWPEWNPDGSEIVFNTGSRFFSVPVLGGTPSALPALDSLYQCSWSHSGDRFVCGREGTGRLVILGKNGENRREISGSEMFDAYAPAWSRDDKLIAFTRGNGGFLGGAEIGNIAPSSIWVMKADGGKPVKVSDDMHLNTAPIWTADGDLLFVSSLGGTRDIYLQRLNGDLTARGQPVRITTGLNPHTISISKDGKTIAYSAFTTVGNVWMASLDGSAESTADAAIPLTTGNQTVEQVAVSPDGQWLAYDSNVNGNQDIYRVKLGGGEPQQLTKNTFDDFHPTWSPDGSEIAFHSLMNGNRDILIMSSEGSNIRPVYEGPGDQRSPVWYGKDAILYIVFPDSIFEVKQNGAAWEKPKFLFRGSTTPAMYSPDGKWLVYIAKEGTACADCPAGTYLAAADGSNPKLVPLQHIGALFSSSSGGTWSRDSRHFYALIRENDGSSSIWQLPINGDAEKRVLHFRDPMRQLYRSTFDVFGEKFYFTIGDRQSDIWTMELKKQN
jgi:Tol biopolymer transport system component